MPRYIRLNNLKQTVAEDLRLARGWKVIVLWIPKLLRRRLDFSSPIPVSTPFENFEVSPDSLSPEAREKFAPLLVEAARLGFEAPRYQVMKTLAGEMVSSVANLRHKCGEIVVRVMHVRVGTVHPPHEKVTISVLSRTTDGRRLVSTDQPATFNPPPKMTVLRTKGGALERLLTRHQAELHRWSGRAAVERVLNDADLCRFVDHLEAEALDNNLRRGLYEEVPPEQIEAQAAVARATPPPIPGSDPIASAVLAEIEKLRNKQGSWRATLIIAALSLGAFVAAGATRWSWQFVLFLTAAVAFHEAGHYIAMRVFKYRDVRMFFVPLLGAAVTGRHYNVKGWQKTIVSLAGPGPGILAGLFLGGAAVATQHPMVEKAAIILLVLNGINLLPFVPLDGGWVLHSLLFSRHYVAEAIFLGFAGLALIGATVAGQGRLWMYLGIFVLVGLPTAYRLARIADRVKKSGVVTTSEDGDSIPCATALAILNELKTGPGAMRHAKLLATQTLEVFQKVNATPPGAAASIILLVVYLASGAGAVVGTGLVMASSMGLLSESGAPATGGLQYRKTWPAIAIARAMPKISVASKPIPDNAAPQFRYLAPGFHSPRVSRRTRSQQAIDQAAGTIPSSGKMPAIPQRKHLNDFWMASARSMVFFLARR